MFRKKVPTSFILCALCVLFFAAQGQAAVISSTALIAGGQAYLMDQQRPDGSWEDSRNTSYDTAATAIALAALMETGVSKDDPAVRKGMSYLMSRFNGVTFGDERYTYTNGASIMALSMYASAGAVTRTAVLSATQRLLDNQLISATDPDNGGWYYYNSVSNDADLSNTQFAAMGLYYAAQYLGAIARTDGASWKDALFAYLQALHNSTTGASYYSTDYYGYIPAMTGASLWCLSLIGHETDPIAIGSTVTGTATPGNVGWFENNYSWTAHDPQYYFLYAWAKGLTAAVGTESKLTVNNVATDWVADMISTLAVLATPAARKDGVQQYYWTSTDSLDGGNIIATSWAMMSMAFADINVESPEKRVSDVPDDEGTIDYPIRGLLTLKTEGGVTITGAKRRLADLFRWKGKTRLSLPVGAVEFTLNHVPVGGTVKLTIKLPPNAVRNDVADSFVDANGDPKPYLNWFKIQNGQWKGVTPIEVDTVNGAIIVWLTDGGPEDADGRRNGTIVDPGAPGITDGPLVEAVEPGLDTNFSSSSDDAECFVDLVSQGARLGLGAWGLVAGLCGALLVSVRRRKP